MSAVPEPSADLAAMASERLAAFARSTPFEAIPAATRERAKHLMLDALGIGLASTTYAFAAPTLAGARALGGAGESVVIGMNARLPLRDALMVNGVLLHGLDYDDTHVPGILHGTVSVLPTVLAQGAARRANGREALAAFVIGIETAARIATAARGGFHDAGLHPTGLVGAFGCTLAAGRLLGLGIEPLVMAQGIALSLAGGSLEFLEDGSWTKRLHPGWAGVAGVTAATLAGQGFKGPRGAYEGRFGLYALHLRKGDGAAALDAALATLGRAWEIHAVAVKPFPLCHFTHACADAAIALHRQGIDPARIRRVIALLPEGTMPVVCEPAADKKRPKNDYDAKFSIPFVVASGLRFGRVGLAELADERLTDPATLALAARVESVADPDADFPRYYPGEVRIELDDGRVLSHREAVNRGAADRPITEAEIVAKFHENAALAVPRARAERICDLVLNLDGHAALDPLLDALA